MTRKTLVPLLALGLVACGPDPMVGSYSFTITAGVDTVTSPNNSTSTPAGTGTIAITAGRTNDYLLTLAHSDSGSCTLTGTRDKNNPNTFAIGANQACVLKSNGATVTAILGSGTITLTPATQASPIRAVSFATTYTFTGTTIFNTTYSGNGSRTYVGNEL